jgi:DNA-binding GntR family transcriptional regulator
MLDKPMRRRGRPPGVLPSAAKMMPVPARRALHEDAYLALRRMIVLCHLPPGHSISEALASSAFGISRTPLREALKLLAADGLVELRSNRGAFVTPIREEDIVCIFEVCAGLERLGAECAAQRATSDDLIVLRALQAQMETHHIRAEREAYFDVNQRIHSTIVAAAQNARLTATHERIFACVERMRFFALGSEDRWDESVPEHREILGAIEARDSTRAGLLMASHIISTGVSAVRQLRLNAA